MTLEGLQLGQYRLLHLLGSGGMGEVYLAEDARISHQVAIKINRSEVSSYPKGDITKDTVRLFQREARAIARLDHPHILPLFSYGEQQVNGMTLIYIVMPFRPEGSFADWLHQRSDDDVLSVQDVAYFVSQAADALQYAHDKQIVHQDVKPSNFLIRTNPRDPNRPDLLLSDFGIARLNSATTSISHSIRGTPAYMAPEIWSGEPTPASDQYALGVMAYELLTGRSPFTGRQEQVMYQHFHVSPQPLSTFNSALSANIDAAVLKALQKKPADRFLSIAGFANALQQATQSDNASTIVRIPHTRGNTELYVTLAISKAEAKTGTTRTLTLQNGQQVRISVPAGAHNGQVLPLEYGGQLSANRDAIGRLMITLLVKDAEETVIPLADKGLDRTLPASDPHLKTGIGSPSSRSGHKISVPETIAAAPPAPEQGSRQSHLSRGMAITIALIVLSLLIVSASIGVFSLYGINRPASNNSNPAATVHANDSTSFAATATTQSNNTQANATAQAINATATSQTNNATLTDTASNTNPFPPAGATLVLNDPLTNNNNGYGWETTPDASGVCQFTGGVYQVNEKAYDTREYCPAYNTNFGSNFAYEVQMTIVQGDLAGLIFRDDTNQVFYFWRFSQDGSYDLIPYHTPSLPTLASGTAQPFNTGYNQSNLLQVIVTNSRIQFFVNNQYVTSVSISSYGRGYIGVFVKDRGNPTEAIFSNAKVWTF